MQWLSPTIKLQLPLPLHSVCHDGNWNVCEWSATHLCCATPVFIILHTAPPPYLCPIYSHWIFHSGLVFWPGTLCNNFKDVSCQKVFESTKNVTTNNAEASSYMTWLNERNGVFVLHYYCLCGRMSTQCLVKLKKVCGDQTVGRRQLFEWHKADPIPQSMISVTIRRILKKTSNDAHVFEMSFAFPYSWTTR